MISVTSKVGVVSAVVMLLSMGCASAQKKYDTGASDTEIKIGNTAPYSGPVSAYGIIAKADEAYFKMINDQGGINGRKIKFISYDDAYSPPKAVEQTRKLVEGDEVLFMFSGIGTPPQSAVHKYLNAKKVPQLFNSGGASKWDDPKHFPWTMGYQPSYRAEARIYAKYILANKPDGKIGVLYQNDDFGKDYLLGLKDVLGDKYAKTVVDEESFEVSDPTIDTHIVTLKAKGADILVDASTQKFAAQAIRKMHEIGWKPMHFLTDVSVSVGSVMKPAGFDAAEGIISASYRKDASDPQWKDDVGMKKFKAFFHKYMPGFDVSDSNILSGYTYSQTLVHVLERCGDDLTRANVMKQAASIDKFVPDTVLPGIYVKTSATDFAPIEQLRLMKFSNGKWEMFGDVLSAESAR